MSTTSTANNETSQGNPIGQPKKIDPKLILRILWSMLRRRWLLLSGSFVLALIVGAVGSKPLTEKIWKATGLLLYTPQTVPDEVGAIKSSLELENMSGFANSRPVLQAVKDDLQLEFPVSLLEKTLNVETSRNTKTIFFSLEWGDKEEALNILDRLMVIYPEYVAKVRQQIAQSMLDEVEDHAAKVQIRLDAARQRFQDFARANNIVDFKQDMILLQTKALGLETDLSQLKRDEESYRDEIQMLENHLDTIRQEEEAEVEANKEFEAAEETLADNRRRQNRLRELIGEERRILEVKAQITVKQREYDRAAKLAEKQLIPQSQLEKVRGELESLYAKITESESIVEWQDELSELDKLVVPRNKISKKGSPIIHQILFTKLQKELKIAYCQKSQLEIERELDEIRTQIQAFQLSRGQYETLQDEVKAVSDERLSIENQASILRQFANAGPTEFSVVSPASTGLHPASSNRKKLFAGMVLAVLVMCGTTIAAFDVLFMGLVPVDAQVEMMGLPNIGTLPSAKAKKKSDDEDSEPEETTPEDEEFDSVVRHMALQFRHSNPMPGDVILFSELNENERLPQFLEQLSATFASRDERVLLLDARKALDGIGPFGHLIDSSVLSDRALESGEDEAEQQEMQLPGLRDFLNFECNAIDEIIYATTITAVDCVVPGLANSEEVLATAQMTDFVEYVKSTYSLIVLLGPSVSNQTDLQIVAAYADSVNFIFDAKKNLTTGSGQCVRLLSDLGAPLAGAIQT